MTVKQAMIQVHIDRSDLSYHPTFDIGFINDEGAPDETQFTTSSGNLKVIISELTTLFKDFCRENGYRERSVTGVTWVNDN